MLQATIAGHNMRLVGCDTMPCAQYVPLFAPFEGVVDFCMDVSVQESLTLPTHLPCERVGDWRVVRLPDGMTAMCHRGGGVMLTADDRFERVTLHIRADMPDRDTVHYLQVMHAFSYYLQHHGGCLLHSAAVKIGGDGIALCGRSGVGKSTMARLLTACYPTATVLCEESPALMEDADGFTLYGTPFCGKDTLCADASAPLRAVVLLRHASQERLYVPTASEGMYDLLAAVPRPAFAQTVSALATDRLVRLMRQVPIYCFENTGTAAAAEDLSQALYENGIIREKVR